jgi:hypothetical protein
MHEFKIPFAVIATIITFAASRTSAIPITFSGGSGTPFSMTLAQPVTYVITTTSTSAFHFAFQNTDNMLTGGEFIFGTVTVSINGAQVQSFNPGVIGMGGPPGGQVNIGDMVLTPPRVIFSVVPGDVITLSAGTLTTEENIPYEAPANGSYNTFLANDGGRFISSAGISGFPTPESLSTLWLALSLLAMLVARRLSAVRAPRY